MTSGETGPTYLDYVCKSSLNYPNENQEQFIGRTEDEFVILQGPPGTGKSLAVGHAILNRAFHKISSGSEIRALVVAPSNRAVNETFKKAAEYRHVIQTETDCDHFDSLRLIRSLSRDLDSYPETKGDVEYFNYNSADEDERDRLRRTLDSSREWGAKSEDNVVVFATPSGPYNIIRKTFDKVVRPTFNLFAVDEASMMPITDFLLAGSSTTAEAQTLIAGDHRQLSPIQKHDWEEEYRRTIRERVPYLSVMDLFRLLSKNDPFGKDDQFAEVNTPELLDYPVDRLEVTYRCTEEVAKILRKLVYERDDIRYRSETEDRPELRKQRERLTVRRTEMDGLNVILSPEFPVVLVVHRDVESQQSNAFEADVVNRLVDPIGRDESVGVITPHNAQRGRLTDVLDRKLDNRPIDVDTVDRFQGSERDVIILSSTVSDPDYIRKETEFILSPNRLNVALSRMRKKLIVLVSESLIEFIPSDAENYGNARLWKMLLTEVRQRDPGTVWSGDVDELLAGGLDHMPLDKSVDVYVVGRSLGH